MARREPGSTRWPPGIVRFARDEDGKVSIVSILAVMAIFGMIGLVANAGRVAREKIELQTAADAAAATTTLWMARSLNAVTTANHLMGEATAVVVLLDGLGGPDFPISPAIETPQGLNYYVALKGLGATAPLKPIGILATLAAGVDTAVVRTVVRLLTVDKGKTSVGAALYDAQMTLKYAAVFCLTVKTFANLVLPAAAKLEATGLLIKIGLALEGVAIGVHTAANYVLGRIVLEWGQLLILEKAVAVTGPPIRAALVKGVLPGLSLYGDTVVGSMGLPGGMNRAIRQSLTALSEEHRLASLEIIPAVERLRLPVEREKPPEENEGGQPPRGWGGNYESAVMRGVRRAHDLLSKQIDTAVSKLADLIKFAGKVVETVTNAATGGKPPPWVKDAQEAIGMLEELATKRPPLPAAPGPDGFVDNPARGERRLPAFDWKAERSSQWARATYPYVDDYRAPFIAWFRDTMPISNAATYLVNWTNRFALVRSYQLRGDAARTHMYVLREMEPVEKGREPWVADARAAADMFAVVAVATREPAAVWLAPRVFGTPGGRQAAVAGGLLYNANGNRVSATAGGATQPDTGWDTLNWRPPVRAPEWGSGNPTIRAGDVLAVFKSSKPTGPKAAVRLNWQGKLVPVDRGLLGRATGDEAGFIRRHERLLEH